MAKNDDSIPLDARLLSEVVIELNITRRNVSIYPKEHPIVEKSLGNALDHLQRLFELRDEVTLSIAKDTLIIDDYYLDKQNPVFRDFALLLSRMDISLVTFINGMTVTDLYTFIKLLTDNMKNPSSSMLSEKIQQSGLVYIRVQFINYDAFIFDEGKTEDRDPDDLIWERYVSGAMEDRLMTGDLPENLREISPEKLAVILNQSEIVKDAELVKAESYDSVISAYVRTSSERVFSGSELRKLMDFINDLRPELKKQFLSSVVRNVTQDMESVEKSLREISAQEVMSLLSQINEQKVAIPETLTNLLNRFAKLDECSFKDISIRGELIADDILLSEEIVTLLSEGGFADFVSDVYQKQIKKLLDIKPGKEAAKYGDSLKGEFQEEYLQKVLNGTLLQLISCEIPDFVDVSAYDSFIDLLQQQLQEFIDTGQYAQVLKTLHTLESNVAGNKGQDFSSRTLEYFQTQEFLQSVTDSLCMMGRLMRDDAQQLTEYYSDHIIPLLMDALADEESQSTRSFLLSLISSFKDKAASEALKRLSDKRWFVQRNMLVILEECGDREVLPHIRQCCSDANPKVSLQATMCLLKLGDDYAMDMLKKHLHSNFKEAVDRAVVLSGAYRAKEAVPDLITLLNRKPVSGSDINGKIPVVKALGQIGDPRAVDSLRNVLVSRSILFKSAVDNLKKEVNDSLGQYPPENVKDLLMKSKKNIEH